MFNKPNSTALAFMVAGAVWFVVGALYGMVSAIHLVSPEFFTNIPWLVFGRERPIHVQTMLYGFVGTTLIGCGLYYVPRLLRTKLWSEPLAWGSFFLWNTVILSGPICFSFGYTQGREYSEYVWWADVLLMLAVTLLIVNMVMTIVNRTEQQLYVSVWYFMATFLWTAGNYPIGNVMWHPETGAMPGLIDSIFLWYWGHNLPGLFITPLATGAAYYIIPRVTKTPLNSHTLSLLGFWLLVAMYTHIGGHHILQSPIPNWLKAVSIVDSVAMVIPVGIVVMNLWLTARQRGAQVWHDPGGRLVMAGIVWYLITCIQGPVQSLPYLQRVTHFNNWTVGHSHIAMLGFAGYIALGAAWHILPQITGRKLWSTKLVNLQFGLITFGLVGFFLVLTAAGVNQGNAWNSGETVYRTLPQLRPYMVSRAALGIFILTGALVGLLNIMMSMFRSGAVDADELRQAEEPL
ncbi:cbb3-type cytochrome c oxidase subunit I [Geobacter sp. DSM 9736]|uniref:cbb3-type cytochrome c oxidase subunit I n=1 Tax=Geobacter sp. DSM 9736 TaxID=1277350 RepID=UPI000B50B4CC|nr:cbb3-type cytochrome c oxidase subunit I [Geobacter sp. DSM 9736]SNB46686.1 cytochrome c oxidase cbb3-type subunit 1 [Geobacter sp. DSM 9736]